MTISQISFYFDGFHFVVVGWSGWRFEGIFFQLLPWKKMEQTAGWENNVKVKSFDTMVVYTHTHVHRLVWCRYGWASMKNTSCVLSRGLRQTIASDVTEKVYVFLGRWSFAYLRIWCTLCFASKRSSCGKMLLTLFVEIFHANQCNPFVRFIIRNYVNQT